MSLLILEKNNMADDIPIPGMVSDNNEKVE